MINKCHASVWLLSVASLLVNMVCPQDTALALGTGTNPIPYFDSFETYTNNALPVGDGVTGWYAETVDAIQVTTNTMGIADYTGQFPLTGTHDKILKLDSAVTNIFTPTGYNEGHPRLWIDMMLQPRRWDEETPPAISTNGDVQMAMYVNSNGYIVVRCSPSLPSYQANISTWTETSHAPIGTGDWVRMTVQLWFYADDAYSYFHIQLNNQDPVTNVYAFAEPNLLWSHFETNWGSWFLVAGPGLTPAALSSISLSGSGYLDDFVVTNGAPALDPTFLIDAISVPDAGASISPAKGMGIPVVSNGTINFSMSANTGYTITNVIVDSIPKGVTNAWTFATVTNNHSLYVYTDPQDRAFTNISAYNTVTPPSGLYDYDSVISASVGPSTYAIGDGTKTQMFCTGWTRTTSDPNSGSGTNSSFILKGDTVGAVTTQTWNWVQQFWLGLQVDTEVPGLGSVDRSSQWLTDGNTIVITAITNGGCIFTGWSGDGTNGATFPTNDQIQVVMNQSRYIAANFTGGVAQITTRGTPSSYILTFYPGSTDIEATDVDDSDGDGTKTFEEFIAGTDPTNENSVFVILGQGWLNGTNFLTWYGTTNTGVTNWFEITRSTNLIEGWTTPAHGWLPREGSGTNTWWDTNRPPATVPVFYRPRASRTF